jgi:hypothetical protein
MAPSPQNINYHPKRPRQHDGTQKGVTTPYHHDLHQDKKKPPFTATWEAEPEEETATILEIP